MTERAQNADFRRKPQIFVDSFGQRRFSQKTGFSQKTEDFCRTPQETQIGLRHFRSVTFSSALIDRLPYSRKCSEGRASSLKE